MKRKGLGKGTGKGYKNITGKDPRVHSDSARGRKQPQKVVMPDNRIIEKELITRYDSRGSFGGKAIVREQGNEKKLYSYNTHVATIKNGKAEVNGIYSQTTTRHMKEFLRQNGFFVDSSKQMFEDYGIKEGN